MEVIWAMIGALFSQGSAFFASIIAARFLGQEEFGKLAMLQGAVATMAAFAGMGLGTTATKFVAECSVSNRSRAGRILGLCTLVTVATGALFSAVLVVGAPAAAGLFRIPDLAIQLRLGAIYVFFTTLNGFQTGALAGFSAFAVLARIGLAQGLLGVAFMTLGAWKYGLTGAVVALGLSSISSWLLNQAALRRACRDNAITITYTGLKADLSVLSGFAAPAALSGCLGGLALTAANTLLVRQPDGLRQIAIFNAANTIRIVVLFVPGLVSRVSTPLLCRLRGASLSTAYREAFKRNLLLNTLLAGLAAIVVFALGPWILLLYGRDFLGGRLTLGLLLAASVAEAGSVALFQVLYSHGRIWLHLTILALWSVLLVGGTGGLVGAHGSVGLAGAYLIAWATSAILYANAARALLR